MGGGETARSLNNLGMQLAKLAENILNSGWQSSFFIAIVLVSAMASMTVMANSENVNNFVNGDQSTQCFSDVKAAYAFLLAEETRKDNFRQNTIDNAEVNINSASEGELATLKGVGSSKAQEIILYREMFGDFAQVEDLTRVKGIGDKTIEKNRHRLRVR